MACELLKSRKEIQRERDVLQRRVAAQDVVIEHVRAFLRNSRHDINVQVVYSPFIEAIQGAIDELAAAPPAERGSER
jgi:hypothetical protein